VQYSRYGPWVNCQLQQALGCRPAIVFLHVGENDIRHLDADVLLWKSLLWMFGASVTDVRTHCRFEMVYRYEVSDTSILTEQNAKVGSMPSASANAPSTPPFVATAAMTADSTPDHLSPTTPCLRRRTEPPPRICHRTCSTRKLFRCIVT